MEETKDVGTGDSDGEQLPASAMRKKQFHYTLCSSRVPEAVEVDAQGIITRTFQECWEVGYLLVDVTLGQVVGAPQRWGMVRRLPPLA